MADFFSKSKIKVLLLEGIEESACENFRRQGYTNLHILNESPHPEELKKHLSDVFILGIRSRTRVTKELILQAPKLFALGCFCIGTDQVDLNALKERGIVVFNAPHSNTRSVAELVIGLIIMLERNIFPMNSLLHQRVWKKSAKGSYEVRSKVLGIVGYGHIGSQVSVLAEALGMQVLYWDIQTVLPLGNAVSADSFEDLLSRSDIVTLHVPETPETENMIDKRALSLMKPGSSLINYSRGSVVAIEALYQALESGHLKGAALDVFPIEPKGIEDPFAYPSPEGVNLVLTPHIGGSTEEAQKMIGQEVSQKLINFSDRGSTMGAVNFPSLNLSPHTGAHRILHIHRNVPGILRQINEIVASRGINVLGQYLLTDAMIGYVVLDIEKKGDHAVMEALHSIEGTIRTRLLY